MRLSPFALLAGLSAFAGVQSADTKAEETKEEAPKVPEDTYFNSIKVPPLLELTPTNWEAELKANKWLIVKHYSPYCPHCLDFAPTYQTTYEYYYTSKLEGDVTSFSDYYGFKFATINCVAYYDLCIDHDVKSYPTTTLYESGEVFESLRGGKNMTVLSNTIEKALEKAKPGSRPTTVDLPEPGDTEFPLTKPREPKEEEEMPPFKKKTNKLLEQAGKAHKKPTEKPADELLEEAGKAHKEPADKAEKPLKSDAKSGKSAEVDTTEKSKKTDKTEKAEKLEEKSEKSGKSAKSGKSIEKSEDTFGSDWKVPTSGEKMKELEPKKPSTAPNTSGVSISLTAESFQRLVTMTQDPWFIKFYAPWCPHCNAMGPTWEQLAKNMQGKLNIGEVNCDKESRLCKDVHARSYPTILFFKGGERAEYQGLRGLGDFVQYAEKALDLASGVPDVDAEQFKVIEEKEEVIFVYFYDHATTSEDFMALERIPLSLIGHAKLVKTSDPELFDRYKITTWPRLIVSREGRPTYFTPLTPNEMRDVHGVLDWMRSVWLPLVPEMTASNARQIMDRKIVVLGVLNRDDQDNFQSALREMKSAANEWMDRQIQEFQLERKKLRDSKQMRIEEAEDRGDQRALRAAKAIRVNMDNAGRKEVGFAWVDGVFWQRWVRTTYGIDVKDGERVIINDEDRRRYWDNTVTGNYILVSRTSIMETLDKIVYGPNVIKPKLTISAFEKVFFDIRRSFTEHPFLTIGGLAGVAFGLVSWFRGRSRRARGHFRLDDSILKDGLLGQNGNAKAD
ncbi:Fc.00g089130.m01.CDS01 [Cosmosporella sp. VM-42]